MNERFDPILPKNLEAREHFGRLMPKGRKSEVTKAHSEALLLKAESFYGRLSTAESASDKERYAATISIAEGIKRIGGLALIVGGATRDDIMRRLGYEVESKDIDIEIYGVESKKLQQFLTKQFGKERVELAGASFQVFKIKGVDIDLSIPRFDSKEGEGHRGFIITGDSNMTVAEAARRRDFTINALAMNPLTGEIIDKYGGLRDIEQHVLRATDPELFGDDPLRVLRAMQFAGRFEFAIDPKTAEICRNLDVTTLSRERIGEEWKKLLLKTRKPSIGLEVARELGIIDALHPELKALIGLPQEPEWHPEGDVWTHTKMVVDEAAAIVRREGLQDEDALTIMLAALAHDFGKPITTEKDKKGRLTSKGHAEAGVEPAERFLDTLHTTNVRRDVVDKVLMLVKEHLFPALNPEPSDAAVRRLAARIAPSTVQELLWVAEADHRGRAVSWDGFPNAAKLLSKAEQLRVRQEAPLSLLQGRDLIKLGLQPGPVFGKILQAVYDAQLAGDISSYDRAMSYAQKIALELR